MVDAQTATNDSPLTNNRLLQTNAQPTKTN
jgi:hypothetical protein